MVAYFFFLPLEEDFPLDLELDLVVAGPLPSL